ncbi:glycine--tRNA ligase subunit beta [endosymbiont of unidentified scaly snail isolate Monju]|uniref:glycine--tRNA ligase subunit beta n=1 Tax=endosymbiont of unidentified scaly snail isolate Monju TaxID=1248727 RepID=UPI000389210E|nr:glycine--tRNA ligase subunit beta [endosymbiont of unidentified scaly snail isolate Monju]BAN68004.1 glycyl-tRNA synthetase beta chain [endosymbiont of unidentified scaly snail isolate Monju]
MSDRADLLFELGTEELPPTALKRLSSALEEGFLTGLSEAQLAHGEVIAYATPRRLALLVRDLEQRQPDRDVERRGPAVKAAFDAEGRPTKAAEGFARSCGTTVDQLERLETDKGEWLVFRSHQPGQPAAELLPAIAERALERLPIPKRMRWGDSEAQFVRPVHWLVFLHGDAVVECTLLDTPAGRVTRGHRFHHPEGITLYDPADYAAILENVGKVIAYFPDRRSRIRAQVEATAKKLGGVADIDEALLDEVTALNEWPVPVAGSFDADFLEVPHEALVSTMKGNQKYFPVFDAEGRLLNHFITIANIESREPEMVRAGNERVIRPRLADARFFWEQDGKKRLEDHIDSLRDVVFEKRLGSMYEKSERVAALAARIAEQIGGDVEKARRAGMLSRCDLMTEMVYEFPDMQGIMGRYQALRDGEDPELAHALDEFYMPRFSGDRLPETRTGIAVALAERLDTLVGIFGIGMKPTGDKDPYALRRAALGALRILREHSLSLNVLELLDQAREQLGDRLDDNGVVETVWQFMRDRLRRLYADAGVSADIFEAVITVAPPDLADIEQRIRAVQAFLKLPEAEALIAANKRIGNILKKAGENIPRTVDPERFEETAEQVLLDEIKTVEGGLLLRTDDYIKQLETLARLREPTDRFFDEVMVMAEDPLVRNNRLALLRRARELFLQVADIGRLQAGGGESA